MMITVIIGVIMMIILIMKVAISPVFCFTSVGKIWVWVPFRWQRLLSVATLCEDCGKEDNDNGDTDDNEKICM